MTQPSPVSTQNASVKGKASPRLVYVFRSKSFAQRLLSKRWFRPIAKKSPLSFFLSLLTVVAIVIAHVVSTPSLPEVITGQIEAARLTSSQPAQGGLAEILQTAAGQPGSSLQRFGHYAYAQAQLDQLQVMASYSKAGEQRFERLRPEATLALMRLMDAARADGVWIVPISAFRDYQRQGELFQARIEQLGSEQAAAKSVAPPGFSEHHTGYAVDLADGLARASDIAYSFGDTAAFRWLQANAKAYGFQLSFPPDNPQGVNYEPWHWRFVGSPQAALTFAKSS